MEGKVSKSWMPLESNPDVFTPYASMLGVQPNTVAFVDVYGVDTEMLALVPKPVIAVLLVYDITEDNQREKERLCSQSCASSPPSTLYFTHQTIHNACGTMAIIHALLNAAASGLVNLQAGSYLSRLLNETKVKTPAERAAYIEDEIRSSDLRELHRRIALEGQQAPLGEDIAINHHFVCFVQYDGKCWELDGRVKSPLYRGDIKGDLLGTAVEIIKSVYIDKNSQGLFNIMALVKC